MSNQIGYNLLWEPAERMKKIVENLMTSLEKRYNSKIKTAYPINYKIKFQSGTI